VADVPWERSSRRPAPKQRWWWRPAWQQQKDGEQERQPERALPSRAARRARTLCPCVWLLGVWGIKWGYHDARTGPRRGEEGFGRSKAERLTTGREVTFRTPELLQLSGLLRLLTIKNGTHPKFWRWGSTKWTGTKFGLDKVGGLPRAPFSGPFSVSGPYAKPF